MHTKMCIHYSLIGKLAGYYKVCLCFIALLVTVCTVGYVCSFCRDQIFMNFLIHGNLWSFIYIIMILKVLYLQRLAFKCKNINLLHFLLMRQLQTFTNLSRIIIILWLLVYTMINKIDWLAIHKMFTILFSKGQYKTGNWQNLVPQIL